MAALFHWFNVYIVGRMTESMGPINLQWLFHLNFSVLGLPNLTNLVQSLKDNLSLGRSIGVNGMIGERVSSH